MVDFIVSKSLEGQWFYFFIFRGSGHSFMLIILNIYVRNVNFTNRINNYKI